MPRERKSPDEEVTLGHRAAEILESAVFIEAMSDVEAAIFAKWSTTKLDQKEEREWLHMQGLAARALRQVLRAYVESGKVSLMSLEQLQQNEARSRGPGNRAPR